MPTKLMPHSAVRPFRLRAQSDTSSRASNAGDSVVSNVSSCPATPEGKSIIDSGIKTSRFILTELPDAVVKEGRRQGREQGPENEG